MPDQQETEAIKDAVVERVRPLSQAAARNLQKLIENDFQTLRQEMTEMTNEIKKAKTKEIRAGATPEATEAILKQAQDLVASAQAQFNALVAQAKAKGITLKMPAFAYGANAPSVQNDELERRVQLAINEADQELHSATVILRRKELEAQRRVLIASITGEAEEILKSMPDARGLMMEAAAEREERQRKALQG